MVSATKSFSSGVNISVLMNTNPMFAGTVFIYYKLNLHKKALRQTTLTKMPKDNATRELSLLIPFFMINIILGEQTHPLGQ